MTKDTATTKAPAKKRAARKTYLKTDAIRERASQLNRLADAMDHFNKIGAKQYMPQLAQVDPSLAKSADDVRRMMTGRFSAKDAKLLAKIEVAVKELQKRA